MIYLDYGATSLRKPPQVARAMAQAVGNLGSPGRGGHAFAAAAAETAFRCRELAAELFGASGPENVIFTMNATHGLNLAIRTLAKPGMRVVVSGYEHNAVMRPLHAIGAEIAAAKAPLFDTAAAIEAFDRAITPDTGLVVVNHVSNVFGFVQPLEAIAAICQARGVPLIVDASQSAGVLPVNLTKLGAAFLAMPGHKGLYGPQGTGLLICGRAPAPLLYGGTGGSSLLFAMPDVTPDIGEAGTHNMPGIAGLLEGLRFLKHRGVEVIAAHERRLVSLAAAQLMKLPGIEVFLSPQPAVQTGVLSFRSRNADLEVLAERLNCHGFALRAGIHCAPLAHETAGTLPEGTVRLSVGAFTTPGEILAFGKSISEIL